ncbi:MAG: L,D-transpeptidase [Prochlorococcaceae cyanobacterium ETNP7_MAG_30]|nr:L,D-transpeptidase [Prochlorococcaceae cyanobacterium ETNP7_MAG_30]
MLASLINSAVQASLPQILISVPAAVIERQGRHLVLDRSNRRLLVLEDGTLIASFLVAVGMPGWETPAGEFRILNKIPQPIWEHPQSGKQIKSGSTNPLGSRWIGFYRDCKGRDAHDGDRWLTIDGCVTAGFHGTPHRWTVGRAVSHGCVRLYEEDIQALYRLVKIGTPVNVLP